MQILTKSPAPPGRNANSESTATSVPVLSEADFF